MNEIKLLFLPHCLKKEFIAKLSEEGEKRGYKVFIAPGGSIIEKILREYEKIDKILGIACEKEIKLAMEYTKGLSEKGTIIKSIELSKDGCKDTEVDLDEVLEVL